TVDPRIAVMINVSMVGPPPGWLRRGGPPIGATFDVCDLSRTIEGEGSQAGRDLAHDAKLELRSRTRDRRLRALRRGVLHEDAQGGAVDQVPAQAQAYGVDRQDEQHLLRP